MKVYIAHNFDARHFLKDEIVPKFEAAGHVVTSNWIVGDPKFSDEDAVVDLEDVRRADSLVLFAVNFSDRPGRGKYVEFGFALGTGKRCIVIIPPNCGVNCIFYKLPNVRIARDVNEAIRLV